MEVWKDGRSSEDATHIRTCPGWRLMLIHESRRLCAPPCRHVSGVVMSYRDIAATTRSLPYREGHGEGGVRMLMCIDCIVGGGLRTSV